MEEVLWFLQRVVFAEDLFWPQNNCRIISKFLYLEKRIVDLKLGEKSKRLVFSICSILLTSDSLLILLVGGKMGGWEREKEYVKRRETFSFSWNKINKIK